MTHSTDKDRALADARRVLSKADLLADFETQRRTIQALREKTLALEEALGDSKVVEIQRLRSEIWQLVQKLTEFVENR